jgi:hypothetical protein
VSKRRCAGCGRVFVIRPNIPGQKYCSRKECQKSRRRTWQKEKLKNDSDYQANQRAAQTAWRKRNPGYWRRYREGHLEYTICNRRRQRYRNRSQGERGKVKNNCKDGRVNARNRLETKENLEGGNCKDRTCETFSISAATVLE